MIGWDRDPIPIPSRYLKPGSVVRSENGDDLRIGVLSESDHVPLSAIDGSFVELRAWRVVVEPEDRVTLFVHEKLAQHIPLLNLQPVSHELENLTGHFPHRRYVILQSRADKTQQPRLKNKQKKNHEKFLFFLVRFRDIPEGPK